MTALSRIDPELDERARAILRGNDRGGYTVPTAGLYPYQWNWDSAFAAWGFSAFDIDRAWTELETLFSTQWDDGMVPHIIFHQPDPGYFPGPEVWATGRAPASSGISQPPVAATMARLTLDADPTAGRARMAALWPKMLAWHRWWREYRCGSGVAAITHPWESGRDNCTDWDLGMAGVDGSQVGEYTRRDTGHVDASMRPGKEDYDRFIAMVQFGSACGWDQRNIVENGPFLMADPGITFILLRAHEDLAAMGRDLGEDVAELEGWADDLRAGLPFLWNPETHGYDARDLRTGRFAGRIGSAAFLAYLVGAGRPELDVRMTELWDAVTYGFPSSDPALPDFEPRRYWRGPSWPVVNALMAIGLTECGFEDAAERLRRETAELIVRHGFFEYFDPMDGTPCGGDAFTWTAAIWLTWAGAAPEPETR